MRHLFQALIAILLLSLGNLSYAQCDGVIPMLCDADGDRDVDSDDIAAIGAANGETVEPGDIRDIDGDGVITGLDARQCVARCDSRSCSALDITPPEISIIAPFDDERVDRVLVSVSGNVTDAGGEVSVLVNGVEAEVSGDTFGVDVPLVEGANTIVAIATDESGNTATDTIEVFLEPFETEIVRIEVAPGSILLEGVGDRALIEAYAHNLAGEPVTLDGLDIEWFAVGDSEIFVVDQGGGSAEVGTDSLVASAVVGVRLVRRPEIYAQPVSVIAAVLQPGVESIPDDAVMFPPSGEAAARITESGPANLGFDSSAAEIFEVTGFTEAELAALLEVDDEDSLMYPVILRGGVFPVGTLLLASQGAPVAGVVVQAEQRGAFTLYQLKTTPLQDLFEELRFTLSSDELAENGVIYEEVFVSEDVPDEDAIAPPEASIDTRIAVASESGLDKFTVGGLDCDVTSGVRPLFTSPNVFTARVGPVIGWDYLIEGGAVRLFQLRTGFNAELRLNPEVRIEGGAGVKLSCGYSFADIPIPVTGPLGLLITPELEMIAPRLTIDSVASATGLRAGFDVGTEYSAWGEVLYTDTGGWEWLCSDVSQCFSRAHTAELFLESLNAGAVPARNETNVFLGLSPKLNFQLGGVTLDAFRRLTSSLPVIGSALENLEEQVEYSFLSFNLGPRVRTVFENAERVVFNEASEGASQVAANASATIDVSGLSFLGRTAFRLVTPGFFEPKFDLLNIPLAEPYLQVERQQFYVDGEVWSEGIDDPLSVTTGDSLDLLIEMQPAPDPLPFIGDVTVGPVQLTIGLENFDYSPDSLQLWSDREHVGSLAITDDFVAAGQLNISEDVCTANDGSGDQATKVHAIAFNQMYGVLPVPNYVGSISLDCGDECSLGGDCNHVRDNCYFTRSETNSWESTRYFCFDEEGRVVRQEVLYAEHNTGGEPGDSIGYFSIETDVYDYTGGESILTTKVAYWDIYFDWPTTEGTDRFLFGFDSVRPSSSGIYKLDLEAQGFPQRFQRVINSSWDGGFEESWTAERSIEVTFVEGEGLVRTVYDICRFDYDEDFPEQSRVYAANVIWNAREPRVETNIPVETCPKRQDVGAFIRGQAELPYEDSLMYECTSRGGKLSECLPHLSTRTN